VEKTPYWKIFSGCSTPYNNINTRPFADKNLYFFYKIYKISAKTDKKKCLAAEKFIKMKNTPSNVNLHTIVLKVCMI